jgi:hypothetical protein
MSGEGRVRADPWARGAGGSGRERHPRRVSCDIHVQIAGEWRSRQRTCFGSRRPKSGEGLAAVSTDGRAQKALIIL